MGNQVLDQKQLKSDQFTANYSKFLQNVGEKNESKLSQEEYIRAEGLYNTRTESMKSGFKEVFNMGQNAEKVKHPDMTKFRQSLDDVKLERRMEKRGLLKSDVEVTNREEILGGKEVNRLMLREESVKHRDMTAGIRRQLSYELRAKAGDYDTLKCLSEFYPEMLRGSENKDAAKARFEGLLQNYGGQSQDEVENKKQRFEALDDMTEIIMKIDLASLDLSSDRAIAANAAELERVSGMAAAFDKLINKNPDYSDELRTRKNEKGDNLGEKLSQKMDVLLAVSDYYRVKKLLIEDETYTKYLNSEIGMDRKESDSFQVGRLKKLIRAAYYLGQNLAAKTRNGFMQVPLDVEENPYAEGYDKLKAEDDTAMRLLSTDPSYEESFSKDQEYKVEALKKEKAEKEAELFKLRQEYDELISDKKVKEYKVVSSGAEGYDAELDKRAKRREKLEREIDYLSEDVKIADVNMRYEYNLTDRQRIERVIYGLEAERLFVPQRWIKMSLDCPEKNDDPNYVWSTMSGNESIALYTKNTGRTEIAKAITDYKAAQLNVIHFDGLEQRYAKPGFDSFDRILGYFAGPNAYGYSNQEMMEQFEIFADVCLKMDEIKKDPGVEKYYESAYKAMVKQYHLQMYGLVQRIKNGLGDVPFALTTVDFTHQMTNMLRAELMAMSVITNPFNDENMPYLKQLFRDDPEGKYPIDMDEYDQIGDAYSSITFGCQGYLQLFYQDAGESGVYTRKELQKIRDYCRDYREKHPEEKISNKSLCEKYAAEHPDEFNLREKLYRKCDNDEAEELRQNTAIDLKQSMYTQRFIRFSKLLKSGKIRRSDKKKLLEYESWLKKEHPELGMNWFKTNGEDDPFLIRRLLNDWEITPDEIRMLKEAGMDPESFVFPDYYEAYQAEENKKKQKNKAAKK